MTLLLDTHIFLWLVAGDSRLNGDGRRILRRADRILISSATMWEIAIKFRLGKIRLHPEDAIREMAICGFEELPVYNRHTVEVSRMPPLHRDPFVRLLVAQAITERMNLLTADALLAAYSELVRCV